MMFRARSALFGCQFVGSLHNLHGMGSWTQNHRFINKFFPARSEVLQSIWDSESRLQKFESVAAFLSSTPGMITYSTINLLERKQQPPRRVTIQSWPVVIS